MSTYNAHTCVTLIMWLYIQTGSASNSHPPSKYEQVSGSEAVPRFQYLKHSYSLETPSCLIPEVNEVFKSVCERYDVAVTNREKVDEALQLFKRVLEVDLSLPIAECFRVWKSQLTNPKFTVTRTEESRDVKNITVRAEEVPRTKRKAQKHIRELLGACHLFLQQRDFLQREISGNLEKLEHMARDIPTLCKGANLSLYEKKNVPQIVKRARDQFAQFPATIDRFWNEVSALLHEINSAVHILEDTP